MSSSKRFVVADIIQIGMIAGLGFSMYHLLQKMDDRIRVLENERFRPQQTTARPPPKETPLPKAATSPEESDASSTVSESDEEDEEDTEHPNNVSDNALTVADSTADHTVSAENNHVIDEEEFAEDEEAPPLAIPTKTASVRSRGGDKKKK
jgi:hypothetical protein